MLPKEFVVCEILCKGEELPILGALEHGQWIELVEDPDSDGLLIHEITGVEKWRYVDEEMYFENVDDDF